MSPLEEPARVAAVYDRRVVDNIPEEDFLPACVAAVYDRRAVDNIPEEDFFQA